MFSVNLVTIHWPVMSRVLQNSSRVPRVLCAPVSRHLRLPLLPLQKSHDASSWPSSWPPDEWCDPEHSWLSLSIAAPLPSTNPAAFGASLAVSTNNNNNNNKWLRVVLNEIVCNVMSAYLWRHQICTTVINPFTTVPLSISKHKAHKRCTQSAFALGLNFVHLLSFLLLLF